MRLNMKASMLVGGVLGVMAVRRREDAAPPVPVEEMVGQESGH